MGVSFWFSFRFSFWFSFRLSDISAVMPGDAISDEKFEQLVGEGIERIPERFLKRIENVAIVIADEPTDEQLAGQGMSRDEAHELLGLYEGVPLTERGEFYGIGDAVMPDKITIFKRATIDEALDGLSWDADLAHVEERVRAVVCDTVWHEVGHYFGWNDEDLEKREDEGTNFSR